MKRKRYICLTLILAVTFLASAERSLACSCLFTDEPPETKVQKAYNESAAVFSGEVTGIEPDGEFNFSVRIKTARIWKGADMENVVIHTPRQSAMCGYNFEVGKKYLVYAYRAEDGLSTSICSRTAIFEGNEDVGYLDKLSQTERNSGDDEPDGEPVMPHSPPKKRLESGVPVKSIIGGESHDSYVISVTKGQILRLKISWKGEPDRNARFFVSRSADFFSGEPIRGQETADGRNWRHKIEETGDYYIYVTGYPTADYTLTATVKRSCD